MLLKILTRSPLASYYADKRPPVPTFRYLSQTEVHVYALSIGASVLLSFFPFLIVVLTIVRDVFHSFRGERARVRAAAITFGSDLGGFIIRNLTKVNHGRFQFSSIIPAAVHRQRNF